MPGTRSPGPAPTRIWANTFRLKSCETNCPAARTNSSAPPSPPRKQGPFPSIAGRTVARRAATVLTHKSEQAREDADDYKASARPRRWLTVSIAAAIVALLAVGLWIGYAWTQTRYYIGEHDQHVAIFNGVSQQLGPIQLSTLEAVTDIRMSDLPEFSQQRVRQTVPARDLYDAQRIVKNLELTGTTAPADECLTPLPATASAGAGSRPTPTAAPAHVRHQRRCDAGPGASARPTPARCDADRHGVRERQSLAVRHPDHDLRGGQMTPIDPVARPRRNVELVLLVLALAVGIGAQALVGVDRQKAFDTDFWFQSGLLAAAALAFHVVLRIRAKYADPVILPLVVALNGLGLAMIHRLDRVGRGHRQQSAAVDPGGHGRRDRGHLVPQGPPHPAPLHLHLPGRQCRASDPAAGPRRLGR